ncbi:MAG: KGK domain-containing protein [Microcystaceae cyanobacterium]
MSDLHKFTPNFNDDDVIQFGESITRFGKFESIVKSGIDQFIFDTLSQQQINAPTKQYISHKNYHSYTWLNTGVPCEVLKIDSQGWQKGKIRIKFEIEFIPDEPEITEPESPLDDIRREINQG